MSQDDLVLCPRYTVITQGLVHSKRSVHAVCIHSHCVHVHSSAMLFPPWLLFSQPPTDLPFTWNLPLESECPFLEGFQSREAYDAI